MQHRRGAPDGNRNALKHGRFTRAAYRHRAALRAMHREARDRLRTANALYRHVRLLEAYFALSQADGEGPANVLAGRVLAAA
jgi:hypothetical protein